MKLMVIGDSIVDEHVDVDELNVSAEGISTFIETNRLLFAGGSANVAKHCARLGSRVCLVHDACKFFPFYVDGLSQQEQLLISQVKLDIRDIIKTRFYCEGKKIFKVNRRDPYLSRYSIVDFRWAIAKLILDCDAVIACDNGEGFFDAERRSFLIDHCRSVGKELMVDCQFSQTQPSFVEWAGASSIFLNEKENSFLNKNDFLFPDRHVKLGPHGSLRTQPAEHCTGFNVKVVDTVGAGDAYLAAWAVTKDIRKANRWAAESCTVLGTALPKMIDLNGDF